jgi:hypothetical protein
VKYADDLVLMAKEEIVLQGMIDRLIEIGRWINVILVFINVEVISECQHRCSFMEISTKCVKSKDKYTVLRTVNNI